MLIPISRDKDKRKSGSLKKFQFKLQTVLEYRRDQVDVAQQAVSKEERVYQEILQHINEYDQLIATAFKDQEAMLRQPHINIAQAQAFPNYIWRLKQFRFEAYQQLRHQEDILLVKRGELKQALIKQKSLEILKEKAEGRYKKALEKAEDDLLSEMTLNKIARLTQYQRQQQKIG